MKKIVITLLLFILFISCKERNYNKEFGEYLNINIPNDLKKISINNNYNIQDFANSFVYPLTNLQRSNLIYEINLQVCEDLKEDCWKKCGEYYSYEISDSTYDSGYYIKAHIVDNNMNALLIEEVKWK